MHAKRSRERITAIITVACIITCIMFDAARMDPTIINMHNGLKTIIQPILVLFTSIFYG
jgi:hypothetical protein